MTLAARNKLVEKHLDLVEKMARFVCKRLPAGPRETLKDDLVSEGYVALIDAASRFRRNRSAAFTTYAGRRILGAMLDELRRCDLRSRTTRELCNRIQQSRVTLRQKLGREPFESEVEQYLGVSAEKINKALASRAVSGSLRCLSAWPDGRENPETRLLSRERRLVVRRAVAMLPPRLRGLVINMYGQGRTQADCSSLLGGVCPTRVQQLHQKACQLLRKLLASHVAA